MYRTVPFAFGDAESSRCDPAGAFAAAESASSNYVPTVRARDLDHYPDFVIDRLHRATGVMSITSSIVLATLKRDGAILDLVSRRRPADEPVALA